MVYLGVCRYNFAQRGSDLRRSARLSNAAGVSSRRYPSFSLSAITVQQAFVAVHVVKAEVSQKSHLTNLAVERHYAGQVSMHV